jgi:hypothetical protein
LRSLPLLAITAVAALRQSQAKAARVATGAVAVLGGVGVMVTWTQLAWASYLILSLNVRSGAALLVWAWPRLVLAALGAHGLKTPLKKDYPGRGFWPCRPGVSSKQ